MKLYFATGNEGKLQEMREPFREEGHELKQVDPDVPEIDSFEIKEVARQKAIDSFEAAGEEPLIVEDTGFFVEAIGGFPGVEAAYFSRTAGAEKLLKLMEGEENRRAYFKTAIGYYKDGEVKVFTGKLEGRIPEKKRGESHPHLPYNSFFVPDHGDGESLAENQDLKNKEMHRRKAVRSFLEWL